MSSKRGCKYCFQADHDIEQCKSIPCKVCRQVGHPHWLCPNSNNKKKNNNKSKKLDTPSTAILTTSTSSSNLSTNSKSSVKSVNSKPTLSQIVQQSAPVNKTEVKRDLQFYIKQSSKPWSHIL